MLKVCEMCGREYSTRHSAIARWCGKNCEAKNYKAQHKAEIAEKTGNHQQRQEAAMITEPRKAFRPEEAAKVLGTSRDTIYALIASGELRSFKLGAARHIPAEALDELIARKVEESRQG